MAGVSPYRANMRPFSDCVVSRSPKRAKLDPGDDESNRPTATGSGASSTSTLHPRRPFQEYVGNYGTTLVASHNQDSGHRVESNLFRFSQAKPEEDVAIHHRMVEQDIIPFTENLPRWQTHGEGMADALSASSTTSRSPGDSAKRRHTYIDLTVDEEDGKDEKDEEVVFVGESRIARQKVREEVCYGTIKHARISAHRVPSPASGGERGADKWPAIPLILRRGSPDSLVICATDPCGSQFGCVDINTARALAPLMDLGIVRIQARLYPRAKRPQQPAGCPVSESYEFFINVYGPQEESKKVGILLSQKNTFFERPYLESVDALPYRNPHYQTQTHAPAVRSGKETFVSRTTDEVRVEVSKVFDGLGQADSLPEMEPDRAKIKTPLLKHQKQGLYFLISKETGQAVSVHEDKEKTSLWRISKQNTYYHVITGQQSKIRPPIERGGILADMMGVGKTLQILALIVSTQDDAVAFANEKLPRFGNPKDAEPKPPVIGVKTTLLISPLSTIGNWETQIHDHTEKGILKYYIYHGNKRESDISKLASYDVIITTYSVVASEFSKHIKDKDRYVSPLFQMYFFRIVLDEAHMIREQSTLQSRAAIAIRGQRHWAVTGTPIQNRLDDLAALLRFLRMKPFDEKPVFNQYIASPFKNADPDCLLTLRLLVDSVTLRRLKEKINLPPRTDHVVRLRFSPSEQELYNATAKQSATRMDLVAKSGHVGGKNYVHVLQMILRLRLICSGRELLGEDESLAGLTSVDAIDVDSLDDKVPSITAKQAYGLLGLMKETNEDLCSVCRKKAAYKDPAAVIDEKEKEKEDMKGGTIGHLTSCYHLLCSGCVSRYTTSISADFQPGCRAPCPICGIFSPIHIFELKYDEMAAFENGELEKGKQKKEIHYRGQSTKVKALLHSLMENRNQSTADNPIKSVVFSCWTSHLDLIEIAFKNSNIRFVRLDGKMTRVQRNASITEFQKNPTVEVILASLMAGGLGLNLTAACRMYIMEPTWNPASEAQAIDRIHRLGQTKPVVTVRYIMEGSFEEKILELQKKKTDLANMAVGKKLTKSEMTKQKLEHLKSLFKYLNK